MELIDILPILGTVLCILPLFPNRRIDGWWKGWISQEAWRYILYIIGAVVFVPYFAFAVFNPYVGWLGLPAGFSFWILKRVYP